MLNQTAVIGRRASRSCAWLALIVPLGLHAESDWGAFVGVTSDFVFRGLSMTRGEPAGQAGALWEHPTGWLAGVWGSEVDPNSGPGATYEVDLFAGRSWQLGKRWRAQAVLTRYVFPDDTAVLDYDYTELAVTAELDGIWSASVIYSPDMSRYARLDGPVSGRSAFAGELAARWPLPADFALVAGVGLQDLSELFGESYGYGSVGLERARGPLNVSLLFIATDPTAEELFGSAAADRWSATLILRF